MASNSDHEVFGTKALTWAIIGLTVIIMQGVLWQPAIHVAAAKSSAQIEQVAAKAPVQHHVAG